MLGQTGHPHQQVPASRCPPDPHLEGQALGQVRAHGRSPHHPLRPAVRAQSGSAGCWRLLAHQVKPVAGAGSLRCHRALSRRRLHDGHRGGRPLGGRPLLRGSVLGSGDGPGRLPDDLGREGHLCRTGGSIAGSGRQVGFCICRRRLSGGVREDGPVLVAQGGEAHHRPGGSENPFVQVHVQAGLPQYLFDPRPRQLQYHH
mmetsp:Transcript_108936/g.347787  ORF Transcript_108936/g.347787 Transcript_108936/m.347787 type:complete len:201 (-) Transcript_108936:706-1308(-)